MLLRFSISQRIPSLEIILLGPVWTESLQNTEVKFSEMQKVLSHFFLFCFKERKEAKREEKLCVCARPCMHMPLSKITLLVTELVTHLAKLCLLCWLWRFEIMNRYVNIFNYASIQTKTKRTYVRLDLAVVMIHDPVVRRHTLTSSARQLFSFV